MNLTWCPILDKPTTWALAQNPRPCTVSGSHLYWLEPEDVHLDMVLNPRVHAALFVLYGEDQLLQLRQLFCQGVCYAWEFDRCRQLTPLTLWAPRSALEAAPCARRSSLPWLL